MRRTLAVFSFLSVFSVAAASFMVLPNGATRAQAEFVNASFVVPASDGYGVADCLASGNECGVIVADAWCEAHGFSRAASFGLAVEEITGSTTLSSRQARPIAITCAN